MHAEQGDSNAPFELFLSGNNIIFTLGYLGKMSPGYRGLIQIVLIRTLILPIVVQLSVNRGKRS